MKPLLLKYLLLFSLLKNFLTESNFTCEQDNIKSIKECTKYTTNEEIPKKYCCMLNIKVGGSSRSLCVPVNKENYDKVKDWPYYLIDNRFQYHLYCKDSGTYIIILNYILYLLIAILLI